MSKSNSFRVGKVSGYLRGRVWYLCYFENGKRRRPRAGTGRDAARQLATQINSQLETGAPYADNPFAVIEIDRIPVETARPIELLTTEQERAFLGACDE